jgi:hypothetical protein
MDVHFKNYSVATIRYHTAGEITSSRGFDVVIVRLPLHIDIEAEPNGSTWLCDNIEMELSSAESGGTERLLASGRLRMALESRRTAYATDAFTIDLRSTPKAIAEYERWRNGKAVDLRLKLRAQLYELEPATDYRRMLCQTHHVTEQEDFRIDKARWIKSLRAVGLSASLLVEIPFPIESDPNDEALRAISDAFAAFENGGPTAWKDCVGHIRPYLENWRNTESTPKVEPKDGSAADRKWKLLNYRDALYKACHFWVHEAASETSRNDALLALSSFAALLKAFRNSC